MSKKTIFVVLAPIPALFVGAIIMQRSGISSGIYGQNIICYMVLGLLLLFARRKKAVTRISKRAVIALLVVACLLLAFTFLGRGLDGVHRWLAIGNFRLYLASIILPAVILMISRLWKEKDDMLCVALLFVIVAMLIMQPDASQLSAFVAATGWLILFQAKSKAVKYTVPLALVGCAAYAWIHIDGLEAVPHVEGILMLALEMGVVYYALGIFSLVILLLPFLNFSNAAIQAKAVGLYYLVIIVSTFFGKFPVPFLGYGISPIVGYMVAIFMLMRENDFDLPQKASGTLER